MTFHSAARVPRLVVVVVVDVVVVVAEVVVAVAVVAVDVVVVLLSSTYDGAYPSWWARS